MEYYVNVSNRMTNANYISNLKGEFFSFLFTFKSYCLFVKSREKRV
jgi:hypothetical protein